MDILTFVVELSGFIYLAFSGFWSVVALMFHRKLKVPLPAALALGFALQAVGFAIMLIIGLANRAQKAAWSQASPASFDPFAGGAQASGDAFAWVDSSQTEYGQHRQSLHLDSSRVIPIALAAAGLILLLIATPLTWFYSASSSGMEISIGLISSGIEVWVLFTILATVAASVLILRSWSVLSPLLLGYFASWWFALSLAALTSRWAFVNGMAAVFQLPDALLGDGSGALTSLVASRVGESWLVILPGSLLLMSAAYISAYRYSQSINAEKANFM